jgi:hypothetical protein
MDALRTAHPAALAALAIGCALAALVLWRWGRRRRTPDALDLLGLDPKTAARRLRPTPVDLGRPISTSTDWSRVEAVARDTRYRRAVETVRARYRLVANPMLLPNTLRTTMERHDLDFRDAMIRVAEDDGLFER